jgi:hypothetical protein
MMILDAEQPDECAAILKESGLKVDVQPVRIETDGLLGMVKRLMSSLDVSPMVIAKHH